MKKEAFMYYWSAGIVWIEVSISVWIECIFLFWDLNPRLESVLGVGLCVTARSSDIHGLLCKNLWPVQLHLAEATDSEQEWNVWLGSKAGCFPLHQSTAKRHNATFAVAGGRAGAKGVFPNESGPRIRFANFLCNCQATFIYKRKEHSEYLWAPDTEKLVSRCDKVPQICVHPVSFHVISSDNLSLCKKRVIRITIKKICNIFM